MRFPCPHCRAPLSAPREAVGRSSRCRFCGRPVTVPAVGAEPARRCMPVRNLLLIASLFLSLAVLIFVGFALLQRANAPPRSPRKADTKAEATPALTMPVATLSAWKLWEEYGENALQADGKYKGKTVRLTASAGKVQAGEGGGYTIALATPESATVLMEVYNRMSDLEKKHYNEGWLPSVLGYIAPASEKAFAQVKRLQEIEILAVVRGMRQNPEANKGYVVILDSCTLK
jgi:hypothetical protein